jgi:acyl carrier protein
MTRDEVLVWLAGLFDEPAANVRASTTRDQLANWDSMGTLTLMADLDEKFDIRLGEQEVQSLASVQDILDLLTRQGKLQA